MSYREHPVTEYEATLDDAAQFIDVREPGEFAGGSLPGAVNIPLGDLPDRVAELDPAGRVVLLCRSGNRSGQAGMWLHQHGFADVVNLSGGMLVLARSGVAR